MTDLPGANGMLSWTQRRSFVQERMVVSATRRTARILAGCLWNVHWELYLNDQPSTRAVTPLPAPDMQSGNGTAMTMDHKLFAPNSNCTKCGFHIYNQANVFLHEN